MHIKFLPPISKLTPSQAAYYLHGYTAKVAGTEEGITEPKAVFSACFGAPFMPLHPTFYANMLTAKINSADAIGGWSIQDGLEVPGVGSRMPLEYTREIIKSAMNGKLERVSWNEVFGLQMPTSCPGVLTVY